MGVFNVKRSFVIKQVPAKISKGKSSSKKAYIIYRTEAFSIQTSRQNSRPH